MSSPISLIIANIFMKHFKKEILRKTSKKPEVQFRYSRCKRHIRDMETRKAELRKFLIFFNNQYSNVHFIIDIEKNRNSPFQMFLSLKKLGDTLDLQVYRKTNTHRQISICRIASLPSTKTVCNLLVHRVFHHL